MEAYSQEYIEILRAMSPAERWETARRLYWHARAIRTEVTKMLHPDWDEHQVNEYVRKQFMYAGE